MGVQRMEGSSVDTNSTISFSDLPDIPREESLFVYTRFGPWKRWSRISLAEQTYLITMWIVLGCSIGFTIFALRVSSDGSSKDVTYGSILIVAALFSFMYVTTGIFQEQPHEMLALFVTNSIVLGYVVINYLHSHDPRRERFKLLRLIFTASASAILLPICALLMKRYWFRQKLITFAVGSASCRVRRSAQILFMFLSAITFDLQLQINFLILVLQNVSWKVFKGDVVLLNTTSLVILASGLIILIFWVVIGKQAASRESTKLLIVFIILSMPNLVYAGYAFYKFVLVTRDSVSTTNIICGTCAVSMRVIVIMMSSLLYANFGEGLKERIYKWETPVPSA